MRSDGTVGCGISNSVSGVSVKLDGVTLVDTVGRLGSAIAGTAIITTNVNDRISLDYALLCLGPVNDRGLRDLALVAASHVHGIAADAAHLARHSFLEVGLVLRHVAVVMLQIADFIERAIRRRRK